MSWTQIIMPSPLFQNNFILRKPRKDIFVDIIIIVLMFIKIIFQNVKKVKRIANYVPKFNLYLDFLIQQTLPISSEEMLM